MTWARRKREQTRQGYGANLASAEAANEGRNNRGGDVGARGHARADAKHVAAGRLSLPVGLLGALRGRNRRVLHGRLLAARGQAASAEREGRGGDGKGGRACHHGEEDR
eukprot:CAMPEP_0180252156 /NCGR_PEP_ID=MMETSP0987-20121128/38847_1 /TAXON_ID=697907 /ORGANISM="non described non described, Strain CCMP2293" /LENGTH=108 /DNA_ID=CAMNT_0022220799 /DNA_START=335 /DNA_END=662 /DNA_ORIENTATION=-